MSSSSGKSMKLHFKGDKPDKKKKKRSHSHAHGEGSSRRRKDEDVESDVGDVGGDEQAWVTVERATDISGPTMLFQPTSSTASSSKAHIVSLNTAMSRLDLTPHVVQPATSSTADLSGLDAEELEGAQVVEAESSSAFEALSPQDVNQVFVASRVLDTFNPPRYTFRTIENRYIGSDKYGSVHCASEAKGPQEEWSIHAASESNARGGVRIQSAFHGGFLSLDEVAGGRKVLRVDQSDDGERDADPFTWSLRVQWKFRHEARKSERAREIGKGGLAGMDKRLKMQESTDLSALKLKDGVKMDKALKRAAKEGRLAEELLDRRAAKAGRDKFC